MGYQFGCICIVCTLMELENSIPLAHCFLSRVFNM
jgi:hypothetical protein